MSLEPASVPAAWRTRTRLGSVQVAVTPCRPVAYAGERFRRHIPSAIEQKEVDRVSALVSEVFPSNSKGAQIRR